MRLDATTRALVTGASRGIGRALAEALAARGASVGLLARSAEELEALARALPGGPERHIAQRAGHVVIVSSGAGLRAFPSAAVYGATKAAQRGFGEALRHELAGTGVGLTMVYARALHHPPFVRLLGAAHGLSPKLADRLLRRLRGPSAAPRTG